MARITFSLPDDIEKHVDARADEAGHPSVSAYIAGLVEADLRAAGVIDPSPLQAVRQEAIAAAEIVGAEAVLAAIRNAKRGAYAQRAEAVTPS